jgi:peptide deformylase
MTIRTIIYLGDKRLTTPSKPVTDFGPELQTLVDDMFETMYAERGIGLAAPQLGINLQLVVLDVTSDKSQQWCLINPEIVWHEGEVWMPEGCLSIPGAHAKIVRPEKIKVKALDRYGNPIEEFLADDWLARCIQHEYDHLIGRLFIDYLPKRERQREIKKYQEALREAQEQSTSE